jgi:hypothetical protein
MWRANLVKCRHCGDVIGRRDQLGWDVSDAIIEHEQFCYSAQKEKKEKDRITKIYREMYGKIVNVCRISNDFRLNQYIFEYKPAPHHMDKPDSEEYRFEKELMEGRLADQSDELVRKWEGLKEMINSSDEARLAFQTVWKREVSTYEDRHGLTMFRFKSCPYI